MSPGIVLVWKSLCGSLGEFSDSLAQVDRNHSALVQVSPPPQTRKWPRTHCLRMVRVFKIQGRYLGNTWHLQPTKTQRAISPVGGVERRPVGPRGMLGIRFPRPAARAVESGLVGPRSQNPRKIATTLLRKSGGGFLWLLGLPRLNHYRLGLSADQFNRQRLGFLIRAAGVGSPLQDVATRRDILEGNRIRSVDVAAAAP